MKRVLVLLLLAATPLDAGEVCSTSVLSTCGTGSGGSGTVTGPGAACDDNDVTRWDGASATAIQCSAVTLSDAGALSGLTGVSSTSITDSGLTSGRVPVASTGGLLVDDADLTFSVDTLTFTKGLGPTSVCAVGALDAANSLCMSSAGITSEGSTADTNEFIEAYGDHTADQTLRFTASASLLSQAIVAPPQAASSTVGNSVLLAASDAVAGSSVAGAAAGGVVMFMAGAGARLTSGNADAGNYVFVDSAGVGTGASSQVLLPAGSASNPGLAWTADDDGTGSGIYRRSADRISFSANGTGVGEFFSGSATSPSLNVVGGVFFTNALGSADAGFYRVAAGEQRADSSGSIGVIYSRRSLETVATTKAVTALESSEIYTNGSDVDGQTVTLPDNPSAGICYDIALTATNTSNSTVVAPNTGETLRQGSVTCGTSYSAVTIGSVSRVCAVVGGSGGVWQVMSDYPSAAWTCTP